MGSRPRLDAPKRPAVDPGTQLLDQQRRGRANPAFQCLERRHGPGKNPDGPTGVDLGFCAANRMLPGSAMQCRRDDAEDARIFVHFEDLAALRTRDEPVPGGW